MVRICYSSVVLKYNLFRNNRQKISNLLSQFILMLKIQTVNLGLFNADYETAII